MSIDVSKKLPIKEACEAMEKYLATCEIDNQYDVFFKGDPAGLRIRIRLERYEDDVRESITEYIYKFTSFHGYDVVILHVPNGYIKAFPKDMELGK